MKILEKKTRTKHCGADAVVGGAVGTRSLFSLFPGCGGMVLVFRGGFEVSCPLGSKQQDADRRFGMSAYQRSSLMIWERSLYASSKGAKEVGKVTRALLRAKLRGLQNSSRAFPF